MGKYDQLRGKLEAQPASLRAYSLSFQQIEDVLGKPLPPSARAHRPWWSNSRHVQAQAWQAAGWEVDSVDLPAGGDIHSHVRHHDRRCTNPSSRYSRSTSREILWSLHRGDIESRRSVTGQES